MFKFNIKGNAAHTHSIIHADNLVSTTKEKLCAGLVVTGLLLLTACSSSSSTPSASGGTTSCTDIAGEPDIMGQITYTPTTVAVGDTVTMHIPVDADTAYVGAQLAGLNSSGLVVGNSEPTLTSGTGYVTIASPGAQTVDVPMTIAMGSGAGSYVPVIYLCTVDLNACKEIGGAGGIGVSYAFGSPSSLTAPLIRFKYFSGGSVITPSLGNSGTSSCVDTYVLTVI